MVYPLLLLYLTRSITAISRGRAYVNNGKITAFTMQDGIVSAKVRGSVNPYFGVYKEPLYTTTIEFQSISAAKWAAAIALIASRASLISRLLLNEIPSNIEASFTILGLHLLPHGKKDFQAKCSCPDDGSPCKHIAGVYYRVAAELDRDPFLLFELRGLSRTDLHKELAKSPLGQALSAELKMSQGSPQAVESYYTRPTTGLAEPIERLQDFWQGAKRLPQTIDPPSQPLIAGIPVKKQGDFPAFWQRDNSFLAAMEAVYQQVRTKSPL